MRQTAYFAFLCAAVVGVSVGLGVGLSGAFPKDEYAWLERTAGHVDRDGSRLVFAIDPPAVGSQMQSEWTSANATVCADIPESNAVPGTVFALYAITQHPKDRAVDEWWELDIELLGSRPSSVWINDFTAGEPFATQDSNASVALSSDALRFCLSWDLVAGHAEWLVDGARVAERALDDSWASRRLRFVLSYWAATREELLAWAGGDGSGVSERKRFAIEAIEYVLHDA